MAVGSIVSFYWICIEAYPEGLNGLCRQNFIVVDWCELGCQTIRKAAVYLANQHDLTDQLDVNCF